MTRIASGFWIELKKILPENGSITVAQVQIKTPVASAECDQITKMGQIICFYVNTHVLKSGAGDFVIIKHG